VVESAAAVAAAFSVVAVVAAAFSVVAAVFADPPVYVPEPFLPGLVATDFVAVAAVLTVLARLVAVFAALVAAVATLVPVVPAVATLVAVVFFGFFAFVAPLTETTLAKNKAIIKTLFIFNHSILVCLLNFDSKTMNHSTMIY
jgi:hypothetical protein